MEKKMFCAEVDCEGAPGCSCRFPEAWESWKFDKTHDKRELFELARDLLDELTSHGVFIRTGARIDYDGERLMEGVIARARQILDREYVK